MVFVTPVILVVRHAQMVKSIILVKAVLQGTMRHQLTQLSVCNVLILVKIAFWLMIKLLNYAAPVNLV